MSGPTGARPWWVDAFAEVVDAPAAAVPLDRAAMLLAAHGGVPRSPADVERQLGRLDALAQGCRPATFEGWRAHLFGEVGLAGNAADYHDPRNSFLPAVLDRRLGLPISLAVVGIEVGRRLGLVMWGVGMPGHFLLGHGPVVPPPHDPAPEGTVFVDCFHGGDVLDAPGCRTRFAGLFGDATRFEPGFLAPVDAHAVLVRMLANLKGEYARRRDLHALAAVLRLRAALPGMTLDEGRELVRVLDATGRWGEALAVLDALSPVHAEAAAALAVERARLLARMN